MASRFRRSIPDNLDPLVDTLANVVGILVIVIALTQIELGEALTRVIELDARGPQSQARDAEADASQGIAASLTQRSQALFQRTDVEAPESAALARKALAALAALPAGPTLDAGAALERVNTLQSEIGGARAAAKLRGEYARALEKVPAQMVARLPDPELVRGKEAWVLVRYGRVYLVNREKLFDQGIAGIRRILRDGEGRPIREDEFDAIALYLRKHPVGDGIFRWQLRTDPSPRVELDWQTRDGGLDHTRLESDPDWQAWLARLSPETDFVRFQVWSDSFETYLAARQSVEAAGLRAGWTGIAADQELVLALRFVPREQPDQPIEVD